MLANPSPKPAFCAAEEDEGVLFERLSALLLLTLLVLDEDDEGVIVTEEEDGTFEDDFGVTLLALDVERRDEDEVEYFE